MQQIESATEQQSDGRSPRRIPGRPFPPGTSGNPAGRFSLHKRAAALAEQIAAEDFGGLNSLSAIDRTLLEQACRLLLKARSAKTSDDSVRLTSEARRGLVALRRRRSTPAEPKRLLREYLDGKAAQEGAGT